MLKKKKLVNYIPSKYSECDIDIHQASPTPESRLTGGGSPNLVDLIERNVPVERKMGAANSFHSFYP